MRAATILMTAASFLALAGCHTAGRGVYSIPVARDYGDLERADMREVDALLDKAHLMGAQHYAPFEYSSAEEYLAMARDQKRQHDRLGRRDYASLARTMVEAAIRAVPETDPDREAPAPPADEESCRAEFERLKALYLDIDKDKAAEVAPVLYARVVAGLSGAEHDLNQRGRWRHAANALSYVEADIDALRLSDADDDGVADIDDESPWLAEDKDGFEDEDGAPDLDNDQDGVPDRHDVKPMDAETRNRWRDNDGAPDEYPVFEAILFASGSTTISAESRGYIKGLVVALKESPEVMVHVKGYTDNTHSTKYSVDLSRRRAQKVQQCLLDQGLPEEQMIVTFHGEADPVGDNSTEAGRAMNRRVEIALE